MLEKVKLLSKGTKQSETNYGTSLILEYFRREGLLAWRQNVLPVADSEGNIRSASKSGLPDILAIWGGPHYNYWKDNPRFAIGRLVGVEVKKGRDRIRPTQEGYNLQAGKLGAITIVARGETGREIFLNFLEQWTPISKGKINVAK